MDTSATNGYFIAARPEEDDGHRAHRKYRENLTIQLLEITDEGPKCIAETIQARPEVTQQWRALPCASYCVWCLKHKEDAGPRAKLKEILTEDPNSANRASRPYVPQSRVACECHGKPLCRKSDCWKLYHSSLG
jgi:hypothetical protein